MEGHRAGDRAWIKAFYDSAAGWWGESWYDGENLRRRLEIVQAYASASDRRILELAAGTGETAAYLCDHGYSVLALDISQKNIALITHLGENRPGLRVLEGDFLDITIGERFPTVCMFEAFGFGSDREQQRLLRKISDEWLIPGGILIVDVYHPFGPVRAHGSTQKLDRLENVPGSVDMTEYSYYDPISSRWIDIWEPRQDPANRRVQSIRCYTPADFCLLAHGCGLSVVEMRYDGKPFVFDTLEISHENIFDTPGGEGNYAYTVILRK